MSVSDVENWRGKIRDLTGSRVRGSRVRRSGDFGRRTGDVRGG